MGLWDNHALRSLESQVRLLNKPNPTLKIKMSLDISFVFTCLLLSKDGGLCDTQRAVLLFHRSHRKQEHSMNLKLDLSAQL